MSDKTNQIFFNGKIFTSNQQKPEVSAMVVRNGKIEWIGEQEDIEEFEGIRIDLMGRRVLPGLIDAHMHPLYLADAARQIACTPPMTHSIEELIEHVRERREKQGPGSWIEGWGYDEGKLKEGHSPNRWDLDKGAEDVPVILTRTCVHIMVANSKALEMAGIDKNTPDPVGGEIHRDSNGEPTGILKERAMNLIYKVMPPPSLEENAAALASLSTKLLSQGITAVTECLALRKPMNYYDLYIRAHEKGLKQRVILYYKPEEFDRDYVIEKEKMSRENPVYIGGLKLMADGSVSGRTAWVDPPFLGDDENYGLPTATEKDLLDAAELARRNSLQMVIHAMGEQAIDLIVDTFYDKPGWLKDIPSVRVEHAAMPTKKALERAAKAGIAFVTQPIFQYAEIESYLKNLGHERTKKTYPVQDILRAGIKLAFSSDAPATAWADPSDPFVAMKAACTRLSYDGTDCGQEHKVDIKTAIELYTREAQEITGFPNIGQLAPGYRADFIVLDKDLLEISPEKIDEIKVEETYMGGELVYRK